VKKLICHINGRVETKSVPEQRAKKIIWIHDGGCNKRLKKIA
jgi:hypothetical protein